jgi:hypothetical protein
VKEICAEFDSISALTLVIFGGGGRELPCVWWRRGLGIFSLLRDIQVVAVFSVASLPLSFTAPSTFQSKSDFLVAKWI